jgi:catechol 2,3-dioxygenase-like lactoylglutathione lyase family enzyme
MAPRRDGFVAHSTEQAVNPAVTGFTTPVVFPGAARLFQPVVPKSTGGRQKGRHCRPHAHAWNFRIASAIRAEQGRLVGSDAMLDHVSLGVSDIERSRRFYDGALRPLGIVRTADFGEGRGSDYGAAPGMLGIEFTITRETEVRTSIPGSHLCFRAPSRAAVDAFYTAALVTGGRDDGAPGIRTHYHPDYYGAFVLDPDGHRIEAVCHAPDRPAILATG